MLKFEEHHSELDVSYDTYIEPCPRVHSLYKQDPDACHSHVQPTVHKVGPSDRDLLARTGGRALRGTNKRQYSGVTAIAMPGTFDPDELVLGGAGTRHLMEVIRRLLVIT